MSPEQRPSIVIRRPDDWHLHLRDEALLEAVLPYTADVFARAIVMPNLVPPVTTIAAANAYRDRINRALGAGKTFRPLMTCYLTDTISADEIKRGFEQGAWVAAKLYPAGATTNSDSGVTSVDKIYPALEAMQSIGMPLLVHGEVVDPDVDVFDREARFIDDVMQPMRERFKDLKVVFEHITTAAAANYVFGADKNLAATITPHHLMINRNAIFKGGLRPHMYCLPVAKREHDRQSLRIAATSGDRRFFLGTDSAPHIASTKECDGGCAGVFNAPNTMECLAQVFDEEDALDQLEAFASLNGPAFYGLEPNTDTITLTRQSTGISAPDPVVVGDEVIKPFMPETEVRWRLT